MPDAPSKSAVKRAGSNYRKYVRGDITDPAVAQGAIETIQMHRAAHQKPLVHANNGVRSMARTVGCSGQVTQRLKRMATILNKLEREPSLSLDKMQDVGGCRAVVTSLDDMWRLRDRIQHYHPEARISDYVESPRSSGYRGIHLIVEYGPGEPRSIEIQIRTSVMHNWAMFVEGYSGITGTNYKQDGDSDFQLFARLLSEISALDEYGQPVPRDLLAAYSALRERLFPLRGKE